jgi:hypothetical protein
MSDQFDLLETEYGVEISVRPMETADQFDDYLTAQRDIASYLRNVDDGMIFGLGKTWSRDQASELIEMFQQDRVGAG